MKIGSIDLGTALKSRKTRRAGLMFAFYAVLALLLYSIVASYLVPSNTHLSAYDDDWDDLSAFRADLKGMGVDTTSMISSPVLLGEIENPEDTVFVVTGVEPTQSPRVLLGRTKIAINSNPRFSTHQSGSFLVPCTSLCTDSRLPRPTSRAGWPSSTRDPS